MERTRICAGTTGAIQGSGGDMGFTTAGHLAVRYSYWQCSWQPAIQNGRPFGNQKVIWKSEGHPEIRRPSGDQKVIPTGPMEAA
jgi:hypothetical protein